MSRIVLSEFGTILGVWAHPDDEAYLMAGTALLATAAGSRVACVTATSGEAGMTADEGRWPRSRLAEIRRREMAASLEALGIEDHTWLGLSDSRLADVDPELGVELLAHVIDRVRPDAVLTFGPDGMTGHPDHVAVGDWAARAVTSVVGDRCVVLAATKTKTWSDTFRDINREVFETGPPCTPDVDLALEVRLHDKALDQKMRALATQPSQTSGIIAAMGHEHFRAWVATEYWVDRNHVSPR